MASSGGIDEHGFQRTTKKITYPNSTVYILKDTGSVVGLENTQFNIAAGQFSKLCNMKTSQVRGMVDLLIGQLLVGLFCVICCASFTCHSLVILGTRSSLYSI